MSRFTSLHVLALLAVCVSWACDKVPLTAPTESTLVVSVNTTSVPINGTAQVTAVVTEAGGTAVHNGTVVTFTASFGTMEPREAQTQGGIATSRFTGTSSGVATINAFSGAARSAEPGITINVGAAAAARVLVRAEPALIQPQGGTVQIIASVSDTSGNALPNTPITFTTDQGSLSANTGVADVNGEVRVSLTTTRQSTVTASVGPGAEKSGQVVVSVAVVPTVAVAGPVSAIVGVPANFTITPAVAAGGAAIREVIVDFGDGSPPRNLGAVTSATTVSYNYSRAASYTVRATATDTAGNSGTGSFSVNVTRTLPTVTITCPTTQQFVGVQGIYTVTPPATPPIPIENISVDFGDGTTRNLGQITGPTSFTKAFGSEGGFTVTATATDSAGQRGTSSCAVIVGQRQPNVTLTPTTTTAGTNQSFSLSVTPQAGAPAITSVTVTRADTGATVFTAGSSGTFSVTFTPAGTYTLNVSVTDASGTTVVVPRTITVN